VYFQKSQTPKTPAQKRTPVYEAPRIFSTDDYFQQQSLASAVSECSVSGAVINGSVASSYSSRVSSDVPSNPSFLLSETLESTAEADIHKRTHTSHFDCAVVDEVPTEDCTHRPVVIADAQTLNNNT